jgi:hypothetical protein
MVTESPILMSRPRPAKKARVSGGSPELRRLSAVVLKDAAKVADVITKELLRQEPSYREGGARVPEEDLRDTIRSDVSAVLAHLSGQAELGDELAAQRDIGERRAEQGLPVESLLRAYQLGGQVAWQWIVEAALADPDADLQELLRGAGYLWEVIDRLCTEVGAGYRVAAAALARRKAQRREELFDALLDGRGGDVTLAREAAIALFLPVEGPYVVIVSEDPMQFPSEPELVLRGRGLASTWRRRGEREVGVVASLRRPLTEIAEILMPFARGRVGVSPPTQYLGGVAEMLRLAELAAAAADPASCQVALFDENMVAALIVSAPDVSRRLADRVFGSLLALDPPNAEVLLETLRAYIEADGSVAAAAEKLYVHRNTVLNRIRRAEGLTGLDFARPRDVATLIIVLESLRLVSRPAATSTAPSRESTQRDGGL